MKKVILGAIICGIAAAVLAVGSAADHIPDGLTIGILTVAVLTAGSAAVIHKDRKRHAWR